LAKTAARWRHRVPDNRYAVRTARGRFVSTLSRPAAHCHRSPFCVKHRSALVPAQDQAILVEVQYNLRLSIGAVRSNE
jgi:hypothetical protein